MASQREFSLLVKIMGAMDPSFSNATNLTKRQLQTFKNNIDGIDKALWGGLTKTAKVGLAAAAAAGTATVALGKKAVDVGSEFEKAMSQWAAVSSASTAQYERAEQAAMKWGRQTSKTATEGAEALTYMATAGWDVERSIDALPRVLKLSEAANLDLAHTSDLVTNAMAATGTEAEDLGRLLDIAAKANNKSNQTAEQLLLAWRKTGANLENLHVDIAESATAIGMLANRGKKAEEAGTALNAVLINMTTGAGQAGKMMEKLGLSAFDDEGRFKGLKQIFVELNDATKDLSDEERNQAFAMLGGKRQVEALTDIMSGLNHEIADGVTEWDYLYENLTNADGALEKMAARRMDNLWGDLKILQSALQDTGIRAYKGFAEPLRDAAQLATQAVYDFSENVSDRIDEWYPTFRRGAKEAASGLAGFGDTLMGIGGWIMQNGDGIAGTLMGIATAITTFHVSWGAVNGVDKLLTFIHQLPMGLGAILGPLAGVAGSVGLATGAITALNLHMSKTEKQLARDSLAKHFGNITLGMKDLRSVARQIVGEKDIEELAYTLGEMDKLDSIGDNLKKAGDEVQNLMLKMHVGSMLNDDDMESLGDNINTLINDGIRYAEQQQHTIRLNTRLLFGDSEEGQEIQHGLMRYSGTLGKQIQEAGEALGDAYKKAMEDKIISPIEQETITKLTQNLIDLENQVMAGVAEGKVKGALGQLDLGNLSGDSLLNVIDLTTELAGEQKAGISEASANTRASWDAAYAAGGMSAADYQEGVKNLDKATAARYAEVDARSAIAFLDTLMEGNWQSGGYRGDILAGSGQAVRQMEEYARGRISQGRGDNESAASILTEIVSNLPAAGAGAGEMFSPEDLDAIQTYYNQSKELFDGLQQIRDDILSNKYSLGDEKNAEVIQQASLVDQLEMMLGEGDKFDQLWATAQKVPELMELIKQAQEEGAKLPEGLTEGLQQAQAKHEAEQKAAGEKAANNFLQRAGEQVKSKASSTASEGMASLASAFQTAAAGHPIEAVLNVRATVGNVEITNPGRLATAVGSGTVSAPTPPKRHALGGIVTKPENSLIGEAGYPEAVIPINNTRRAADLFAETGRMLNAAGANVGGSSAPVFAPQMSFVIQGNADERTIRSAMRSSYDEWLSYAQRYQRDAARLAY